MKWEFSYRFFPKFENTLGGCLLSWNFHKSILYSVTLRWASIPGEVEIASREKKKYSQSLHVTETGISSGLMGHLARMQTLPIESLSRLSYRQLGFNHLQSWAERGTVSKNAVQYSTATAVRATTQTPRSRVHNSWGHFVFIQVELRITNCADDYYKVRQQII